MRRIGPVLMVMAITTGAAHAEGAYGGMGVGGGNTVTGQLGEKYSADGMVGGRFLGGKRIGAFAVEGAFFGTDLASNDSSGTASTFSLGIDLKAFLPLGDGLEAYGKLGLSYTWLAQTYATDGGYDGRSKQWGLGLQYVWRSRFLAAGVYIDYTRQSLRLHADRDRSVLDGGLGMITAGFMVGRDL